MGRNSVEATNARLSSAVRAALAALAARPIGFLAFFLPGLAVFRALCDLEEAEAVCRGFEPPEVCPDTAGTVTSKASAQATHSASRETRF
jgi:hypothetical protein